MKRPIVKSYQQLARIQADESTRHIADVAERPGADVPATYPLMEGSVAGRALPSSILASIGSSPCRAVRWR